MDGARKYLGRALRLEKTRTQLDAPLVSSFYAAADSLRTYNIAAWAWLHCEFDPTAACLMIER